MTPFFALLVNPRTGVLYQAVKGRLAEIKIKPVIGSEAGAGSLNSIDEEACEEATGFPRSHVYEVERQGIGLGTVVYTALTCAAFDVKELGLRTNVNGPGVSSSPEDRTDDASAWWSNAEARGLTTVVDGFDAYAYDSAVSHHLVVAKPTSLKHGSVLEAVNDLEFIDRAALAGVDLFKLATLANGNTDSRVTLLATKMLWAAYESRADEETLDRMKRQFLMAFERHLEMPEAIETLERMSRVRENPRRRLVLTRAQAQRDMKSLRTQWRRNGWQGL